MKEIKIEDNVYDALKKTSDANEDFDTPDALVGAIIKEFLENEGIELESSSEDKEDKSKEMTDEEEDVAVERLKALGYLN